MHDWDTIRDMTTVWPPSVDGRMAEGGVHESVFRSYQILREVKRMLAAGDSSETIFAFVRWAESAEDATTIP